MAVLREKIVRFTCNTCMYGIHFVWREWGDEWAMGRGGGLSGLGENLRGGGSIAGITFGHVAGGGGVCVLGDGGTFGWGLMVRARIQGFSGNCAVGEGGCWAGCC